MKTNYHTHTTFCDGKISPEEMVRAAIEKKFDILGFSSHAAYPYASNWHLQVQNYQKCVDTIKALKEKYKQQLEIYLGFEADYIPLICEPSKLRYQQFNCDYLIGSVHYLINPDDPEAKGYPQEKSDIPLNCFTIDGPLEEVQGGIHTLFHDDGKKAAQTYFALEREMVSNYDFDIVGHIDILRKRNSILKFFDENDEWYKRDQQATAKAIAQSGKVVEINCGGIPRGTLNDTYPSVYFLTLLHNLNVPVMINSDAHNSNHLDGGFDIAFKNAKTAGYTEIQYFSNGNWFSEKI